MSDLTEIDVVDLYEDVVGEGGTGRLRLFEIQNYESNPYAEPADAPRTVFDAKAVAIHLVPIGKGAERSDVGIAEDKTYRCTIRPPDDLSPLKLHAYALLEFQGIRITGAVDRIDRKTSKRIHLYIDASKNFPLELESLSL